MDSVLKTHASVTCYDLPLRTQTGALESKMNGCHLFVGDTLFFFYAGDDGQVWAWGRDWHVPDSARSASFRMLAQSYTARFGPVECAPILERVEGFRVWHAAGYFIYAFADSEATKLGVHENISVGARLGSPTCTFEDNVSEPFLR